MSSVLTELAINGGTPVLTGDSGRYDWPVIDRSTEQAVLRQLAESISIYNRSGVVERLEEKLQATVGRKHALLTSSGTAALHSMYVAADLGPGDEVVCPAYTFFATATPLFFLGATPVLADCGPDGNVTADSVRAALSPRTKAIVVTHMWGIPCDMEALSAVAQEAGVVLLADASHAFGATRAGRPVCALGDAAAQSMQGQKPLTGGEGGVFLTDDDEMFYRAIAVGHYNRRCKDEIPAGHLLHDYAVTGMGLKLRIHPLAAAIAEDQLGRFPDLAAGRQQVADLLATELADIPGLSPVLPAPGDNSSWYALNVRVDTTLAGDVPMAALYEALHAEGAGEVDRPGSTCPLPMLPLFQDPGRVFRGYDDYRRPELADHPGAVAFHESVFKLPVWHDAAGLKTAGAYAEAFRKVFRVARDCGRVAT
jgi:dTDP-4-amino-4,6-dideoxygalactose transaminase